MDQDKICDILKNKNPFISSSAGDPRDIEKHQNVDSINKETFYGLIRLIRQKTQDPAQNFACLILGEVGAGKTHLIGRMIDFFRMEEKIQIEPRTQSISEPEFAYIQPLEDPKQTFRYLLREVAVNMRRNSSADINSSIIPNSSCLFDRLTAMIICEMLQKKLGTSTKEKHVRFLKAIEENPLLVFDPKRLASEALTLLLEQAVSFVTGIHPEIPGQMLEVLFQYRDPKKREAAFNWFKGSVIDEGEARLLEVYSRNDRSDEPLEQEAQEILIGLGCLIARYGLCMVICFDRLENMETEQQVHALGRMIEFLVDTVKGMLPIACFRGSQWEIKFRNQLNQHIVTRLETNTFELTGCDSTQALEIIHNRLSSASGTRDENDFSPFDQDELKDRFKDGFESPREIITQAGRELNRIFSSCKTDTDNLSSSDTSSTDFSSIDILSEEFERNFKSVLNHFDHHEPDRNWFCRALELYLKQMPEKAELCLECVRPGQKRYIDFVCRFRTGKDTTVPTVFIIDMERHHKSVEAALKRGLEFLEEVENGTAFYIRDERCRFPEPPQWESTNRTMLKFKKNGGIAHFLDMDQAAGWYALALLEYAVTEGNIDGPANDTDPDSLNPVSRETLEQFVNQKICSNSFHKAFQSFDEMLKNLCFEK
ncbi:hypothetical protein QUF76_17765 [Desulfobacterales bacterium HSG16]|nr:hypothetical protein [Desulfobacterales bacterium HSG16]